MTPTSRNPQPPRRWVIPAIVAAILFIGAVAGNLVATYVQPSLEPYRLWVTAIFVVSFIVAVAFAIAEARRSTDSPPSSAITETRTVEGDVVARDKITKIYQVASPAATALHQLRAPVGDFVGREQEIETLVNALRSDGRASITGISGMGGIGKTELALFVAERLASEYADAQFFVSLQGTDPNARRPEEVLATFIRAFVGLEAALPDDLNQLTQLYLSQLSGKRVLVVLDNAADSAQVRPLLPPTGSVALVTSRHALTLPGMTALTLNPLTAPEARQLLIEVAPRAEPVADQVCRLCGYLPLAIRAAGSLLAVTLDLDPAEYAEQLKDERTRLERLGTEGVEIGFEASFNLSYARLDSQAARVFRQLAVFPATFDATTAEVVCADAGHVHLSDLVRRSLVLYDSGTKRYRLHDLARLFADSRLSAEERSQSQRSHSTHFQTVLSAADDLYLAGGESVGRGLALFDLEWANIEVGHAWAVTEAAMNNDAAKLCIAYPSAGAYILSLRQDPRERIGWWEASLGAARRLGDRSREGSALGNIGATYVELGEARRAISFCGQALVIDREVGDRRGEAADLGNLGNAYRDLGETRRAIALFEEVLAIYREVGDRRGEGTTLGNLGIGYKDLGEPRRAIELYEEQLVIVRELGDRRGASGRLCNLANAYFELGEIREAIEFYEQALVIDSEISDRRGEGTDLNNIGVAYANLGETSRAFQFFERALNIACEVGDSRGEGTVLFNMSLSLVQVGEPSRAISHAEQALAIFEQIEDPAAATVRAQLAEWTAGAD